MWTLGAVSCLRSYPSSNANPSRAEGLNNRSSTKFSLTLENLLRRFQLGRVIMLSIFRAGRLAAVTASAASKAIVHPFTFATNISQHINNASAFRVPIPFGDPVGVQFSEPTLVHTAEIGFNINNVANDEEWNEYVAKGRWYACLLDMTIEKAGKALDDLGIPPSSESIFQGDFREDLQNWGWHESPYDPDVGANFIENNRIKPVLDQFGLSALPLGKGGENECWSIEHGDEN